MTNGYDFGFSFTDEEPTSTPTTNNDALQGLESKINLLVDSQSKLLEDKYQGKLKEVESLILPLLYNLMKNPEKTYIKWENRAEVIQKQIDRITAITRS